MPVPGVKRRRVLGIAIWGRGCLCHVPRGAAEVRSRAGAGLAVYTLAPMAQGSRQADEAAIAEAAKILRGGGLVAFPTETVYGLGANALDPAAVAKVFEAKGRPTFDPLIVHVATTEAARELVADWPEAAAKLAAAFWPGPLTIVLKKVPGPGPRVPSREAGDAGRSVADLVTSGLPSVGVRVPRHPVALKLLEAAGVPIAAPSANRFGAISPTNAGHVAAELGDVVNLILDGGPCEAGLESTVVSLVDVGGGGRPKVLRLGATPVEAIEAVVGEVEVATAPGEALGPKASPGMLERHYAPRTPLRVMPRSGWKKADHGGKPAFLCFRGAPAASAIKKSPHEVLSRTGDLREAAANLFAALRRLDESGVDVIVAELAPDEGLGKAINDRLQRAAAGR